MAAVSNVYNQYDKALMYGDVDPASYLPEFQAALEAAGINDILADYQAQVDAWVEQYEISPEKSLNRLKMQACRPAFYFGVHPWRMKRARLFGRGDACYKIGNTAYFF